MGLFDLKMLSVLSEAIVLTWNYRPLNANQFGAPEPILNAVSQTSLLDETYFCEISYIILVFWLGRLSATNIAASAWF